MIAGRWCLGSAVAMGMVACVAVEDASARLGTAGVCRAAIVKGTGVYLATQAKALAKCWDTVVGGKQVGPCPDVKAQNLIAKGRRKLDSLIGKACGGADKICGTATAPDVALGILGWNIGTCSNFGGGACTNAIADCNDIADCVACVSDTAVAQGFGLYYQEAVFPVVDKQLRKCVLEIGRTGAAVLSKLSQGFAKCWLDVNKSDSGGSFSCPDSRASIVSGKAKNKLIAGICKRCGGKNGCGGGDDVAPLTVGFPLQCPAVGTCGGSVQTISDVANCIACVTGIVADGAARTSIPAFTSPPPQCVVAPISVR